MANKIDRLKGKSFKTNPENINKKGRPRTTVRVLLDDLKSKGYKTINKEDIKFLYLSLLDNSQEELSKLTNDKESSMIIRVVAKSILDKKGFDIIEKMLDRTMGKPAQLIGEDSENRFGTFADAVLQARNNMLKDE